ncbi:MAG TPA: hypothetical protein VJ934_14050 [Desulfomicrobiaceae bacterium]|nr:hypothetical protein [Desulfomicrobiaceae bacterium]
MNCRNCNTPYESTPSVYQMESRNRLFCFEDVPALKCPECEHLFIPEAAVKIMLEQIAILSNGSPIPYIKWKWNKKSNIQTPDELADELLSKGSPDQEEEEEKESAETDTASSPTPADKTLKKKTTAAGTGSPGVTLPPTPGDSAETVASQEKEETASDAPRTTRTKGVVVRKRKRIKADSAV